MGKGEALAHRNAFRLGSDGSPGRAPGRFGVLILRLDLRLAAEEIELLREQVEYGHHVQQCQSDVLWNDSVEELHSVGSLSPACAAQVRNLCRIPSILATPSSSVPVSEPGRGPLLPPHPARWSLPFLRKLAQKKTLKKQKPLSPPGLEIGNFGYGERAEMAM